jgi:hypothetical protein
MDDIIENNCLWQNLKFDRLPKPKLISYKIRNSKISREFRHKNPPM